MRELHRVHFPGYSVEEMTLEGQWQPNLRAFTAHREVWNLSRKVMNQSKIRRMIRTFKPLKSVGTDGMAPALLQQGISYSNRVYTQSLEAGQGDVYPTQEG